MTLQREKSAYKRKTSDLQRRVTTDYITIGCTLLSRVVGGTRFSEQQPCAFIFHSMLFVIANVFNKIHNISVIMK